MESLIGRDISKYHILEQLGEGGMAVVYKALDTSLERFVAIKLIRKDTIGEVYYAQMLQRFEREAKVLASLDHPNIVTIFEYGQYQGSPYLVEKFISGGALRLAGRQMLIRQAARRLAPVARALEYAHHRGIIHRDVKPANILIGDTGDPLLSDFGIAKILDMASLGAKDTFTTSTGMQIGTPQYMAPEQWQGKPSTHSDIYALGMVLYEMVTGRLPYTADTPAGVMIQQATQPLPHPCQFAPELPAPAEELILKALALKVEERCASMGEFAAALEQLAYADAPQDELFKERARLLASAATLVEPAAPGASEKKPASGGENKTLPVDQEPEPGQVDGQKPRHSRLARPIWLAGGGGLAGLILLAVWLASSGTGPAIPPTSTATHTLFPVVQPSPATPSLTAAPTKTATRTATPFAAIAPLPSFTPAQQPTLTRWPTNTMAPASEFKPTATYTPTKVRRPRPAPAPTADKGDTPVPP